MNLIKPPSVSNPQHNMCVEVNDYKYRNLHVGHVPLGCGFSTWFYPSMVWGPDTTSPIACWLQSSLADVSQCIPAHHVDKQGFL